VSRRRTRRAAHFRRLSGETRCAWSQRSLVDRTPDEHERRERRAKGVVEAKPVAQASSIFHGESALQALRGAFPKAPQQRHLVVAQRIG
jgi:hypothetical protein